MDEAMKGFITAVGVCIILLILFLIVFRKQLKVGRERRRLRRLNKTNASKAGEE
jgi:uncharacterized membrane protein YciS (DUF1049 family)